MGAAALGTGFQVDGRVFVSAVQAAVAVVIYRAVTDVVPVHHVHHTHNDFGVVGGVAVNFYIEDVSAAGQVVVGGVNSMTVEVDDDIWYQLSMDTPVRIYAEVDKDWHGGIELEVKNIEKR